MATDPYIDCLRALHNLSVAVERAREVDGGDMGLIGSWTPLEWMHHLLKSTEREICPRVGQAWERAGEAGKSDE